MKIAVTGKGGVGKTSISAILARIFSEMNKAVIAIDADPDANLAMALGLGNSPKITPLREMKTLIEERMGVRLDDPGGFFRMNPKVDDIPEKFSTAVHNIRLLVMGTISEARSGCQCPENLFLRQILNHVVFERDEAVIVDMEAGIEHLGRGTAEGVDSFVIVCEPTLLSLETTKRISTLARGMGIGNIVYVGNKVQRDDDAEFMRRAIPDAVWAAFIPYDAGVARIIDRGLGVFSLERGQIEKYFPIAEKLCSR